MDVKQLQALANELAKNIKTPDDLNQFDRLLKKLVSKQCSTPN
jgi:putative transposase